LLAEKAKTGFIGVYLRELLIVVLSIKYGERQNEGGNNKGNNRVELRMYVNECTRERKESRVSGLRERTLANSKLDSENG